MTKPQPERLELTSVRPGMTVEEVSGNLIPALERAGIKVTPTGMDVPQKGLEWRGGGV